MQGWEARSRAEARLKQYISKLFPGVLREEARRRASKGRYQSGRWQMIVWCQPSHPSALYSLCYEGFSHFEAGLQNSFGHIWLPFLKKPVHYILHRPVASTELHLVAFTHFPLTAWSQEERQKRKRGWGGWACSFHCEKIEKFEVQHTIK